LKTASRTPFHLQSFTTSREPRDKARGIDMSLNRNTRAAVIALSLASAAAAAMPAAAGDTYTFPSANGTMIAATATPQFAPPVGAHVETGILAPGTGGVVLTGVSKSDHIPLPIGSPDYKARFGMHSQSGDAYAYRFLTHALASQSYANYAADYYRLFAPGYAVTAWTDRVAGFVETGYGGAVDSWTGGAYYLGRVRGPSSRRNSPPDLSRMPVFRPHPELETNPTFGNTN